MNSARHAILATAGSRLDTRASRGASGSSLAGRAGTLTATRRARQKATETEKAIQRTIHERWLVGERAAALEKGVLRLEKYLPDLEAEVGRIASDDIIRLVDRVDGLVNRLLMLKEVFPTANVSRMVLRNVHLSSTFMISHEDLESAVEEYRAILPGMNLDRVFEWRPSLLDLNDHSHETQTDEEIFFLCRDVPELTPAQAEAIIDAKKLVVARQSPDITSMDRMIVRHGGYGFF